ncbi:hypothetical protein SAMN05421759_11274 [Roseivivax lentus]|uniref:Uncharacterized protein n=1 Tax=Roseivivax lentus TaxID=633194 RepID=A0A1N7P411_9RHOB|nr:hypothetical protein SAMN05421759_11274 [Roseivivax lentus]
MLEEREPVRVHQPAFSRLRCVEKYGSARGRTSGYDPVPDRPGMASKPFRDLLRGKVSFYVFFIWHVRLLFTPRRTYAPKVGHQNASEAFLGNLMRIRQDAAEGCLLNLLIKREYSAISAKFSANASRAKLTAFKGRQIWTWQGRSLRLCRENLQRRLNLTAPAIPSVSSNSFAQSTVEAFKRLSRPARLRRITLHVLHSNTQPAVANDREAVSRAVRRSPGRILLGLRPRSSRPSGSRCSAC